MTRTILFVQLSIPPLGPAPIRGNVPLAAAYLKLFAGRKGLDGFYEIEIFPARQANTLGDRALVEALAGREPWMVGFTCYVWNIERTLWVARELKRQLPGVQIVLGGPEITADNEWVLDTADYDFAVIGEGEQTFADLLVALEGDDVPPIPVAGLYVPPPLTPDLSPQRGEGGKSGPSSPWEEGRRGRYDPSRRPAFRTPMPDLNALGSPYLAGMLDAADEQMLLLETTRGCVFKCKFCYYPKSYDRQYFLAPENILANLRHADERGAREVFILDPTMNQRKDFADFLRVLARGNPGRRFSYFGELRGEGVTEETARLLREANFTEVEVGLQSIEPEAQKKMDRKNNLRAFERGVRAMMARGIAVKVDLIVGLPGDTAESVRRGLYYLRDSALYSDVQVFNLSILPGTAFRQEAAGLGLKFQPRPPYYLLNTPALGREDLYELMQEAQELFGVEFDAQPAPVLDFPTAQQAECVWRVDLDRPDQAEPPSPNRWRQAFTLWLRAGDFNAHLSKAIACIRQVLEANPFTTLQVVLDVEAGTAAEDLPGRLGPRVLESLYATCQERPTYLDRYYGLQPGGLNGAKRLVVVLPGRLRACAPSDWVEDVGEFATVVWQTPAGITGAEQELQSYEHAWVSDR